MAGGKRRLRGEIKRAQQLSIVVDPGILRRQKFFPVKDRVCPCENAEGLRLSREHGPPGGQTDLRLRQCDSGRCDQTNQLENVDRRSVFERCSRHRHQAVYGYTLRRRIKIGQYLQHLEPVKFGLSHSDNPATADGDIRLLHGSYRIEPIRITVSRDDFRIILLRSIDIMVVGSDTCFLELFGFTQAELSKCDADFHPKLTHRPHNLEYLLKSRIPVTHTFPRRSHAKSRRTVFPSATSYIQHVFRIHQALRPNAGVISCALSTVSTVLAAPTGLDAQQRAEL